MDYGKAAYLKIDDLSKRLASLERGITYQYGGILITGRHERDASESLTFCNQLSVGKETSCQVLIKMRLESESASEMAAAVMIGEISALSEQVMMQVGDHDYLFLTNARLTSGVHELTLKITAAATLKQYDVMIFGDGITSDGASFALSLTDNYVCLLSDGVAQIYSCADINTPICSIMCDKAVLCETESADKVIFCIEKTVFVSSVTPFEPTFVASEVDDVTMLGENRYAVIRNGVAYAVEGSVFTHIPLASGRAQSLMRVNEAMGNLIISIVGGKLYYNCALPSFTAGGFLLGEKL